MYAAPMFFTPAGLQTRRPVFFFAYHVTREVTKSSRRHRGRRRPSRLVSFSCDSLPPLINFFVPSCPGGTEKNTNPPIADTRPPWQRTHAFVANSLGAQVGGSLAVSLAFNVVNAKARRGIAGSASGPRAVKRPHRVPFGKVGEENRGKVGLGTGARKQAPRVFFFWLGGYRFVLYRLTRRVQR